jgi:hypothetical protein
VATAYLAFEHNKQRVRGIAFPQKQISGRKVEFL